MLVSLLTQSGDAISCIEGQRNSQLTIFEFRHKVEQIAVKLCQTGVKRSVKSVSAFIFYVFSGDFVLGNLLRSTEAVAAVAALRTIRAVYVPVDTGIIFCQRVVVLLMYLFEYGAEAPADYIRAIIADCKPRAIITSHDAKTTVGLLIFRIHCVFRSKKQFLVLCRRQLCSACPCRRCTRPALKWSIRRWIH